MKHLCLLIWLLCAAIPKTYGQGTADDYKRAYGLNNRFKNTVYRNGVQPTWLGNAHSFWYVTTTPKGKEYYLVDADKANRRLLFDTDKLTKALSRETGKSIKQSDLVMDGLVVSARGDSLTFTAVKSRWIYLPASNKLMKQQTFNQRTTPAPLQYWGNRPAPRRNRNIVSPDRKQEAFIRDNNIWIRRSADQWEYALTKDGTAEDNYNALQWSPDGKKLACMKTKPAKQHYIYFVESSPKDQLQPKLQSRPYSKPGDSLTVQQPCLFNLETGRNFVFPMNLIEKQYDLRSLRWGTDSRSVTFEFNQRGHQAYRVYDFSALTGQTRCLIDETSDTYVNYNRLYRHDLKNGREIIWMSERDNWNHLYLYDRTSGKVTRQITKGEWYVREVLYVDESNRQLWFTANGVYPNEDPYLIRYYRINLDGSGLTCLTPDEGMHTAWFSKDKRYLVDVYSKTDMAPVAVLRSAKDGKVVLPLEKADISTLIAKGWKAPETFVAKGRDGKTDMWGLIYRPTNFDPSKKYPIIEYIYSGPGSQYVPKTFSTVNWNTCPLAELGFIVVQLDAMSTSFRSKAFESICYKNLQDAGLPDRIAWIKAAAKKYAYMDINRVGIFGASAGGQEALTATLDYPNFYKAAYSSCGCHDNRMDKIWWNEQWMGYPVDSSYIRASNVVNAHKLRTPLMLVVGELDDNVDPASTMQVVDALIKANKNFELVVLPGVGHTMGETYGEHKRFDFFVRHLLGVNPPAW